MLRAAPVTWKAVSASFSLLGHVALVAQRLIVVKLSHGRSVGPYVRTCVRRSVCPVHCRKTGDRIRMTFGIVGRTGPGMRQVVGFGDRSTGRGTFWDEFGAHHCNQWGLHGVCVRQRRDAALFPNYFGQTCHYRQQQLSGIHLRNFITGCNSSLAVC